MPAAVEVSDAAIAYAENLLLPPGATFDAERRAFIRRFDTLDLQAVPGSGKTTALLAKLIILERHLPFEDGSGVLVLSHTNAAMDEISHAIGHLCPRLFSYPNFVGTIQTFVDHFLALPYFCRASGKRPVRIHNDLYEARAGAFMRYNPDGFTADENKRAKYFLSSTQAAGTIRYAFDEDKCVLLQRMNGKPLTVTKPKCKLGGPGDWTDAEKKRVNVWLLRFKRHLMDDGVLCFDDAYYLAHRYLATFPEIASILRLRFRHVFVDEMQDMARHQHDLLERLFIAGDPSPCTYQRIGDRNQAIHNERDFGDEAAWIAREPSLTLTNSMRLSPQTAAVVSHFALHNQPGFQINGLRPPGPRPVMIVYNDATATAVLQRFSALIQAAADAGHLPITPQSRFRAVAWNTVWTGEEPPVGMLRLINYYPEFNRAKLSSNTEHDCLADYISKTSQPEATFRMHEAGVMNALLKLLRLERVQNPLFKTHFTRTSLLAHLRVCLPEYHPQFRSVVYGCCSSAANGQLSEAIAALKAHIPVFLGAFGSQLKEAKEFVEDAAAPAAPIPAPATDNIVNFHGFNIAVASVHAVKGQTHTATLYFETAFGKDGKGAEAKSYESQRLAPQFLGTRLAGGEGKRTQQSAKMVYVGFSRPTHFLCFAVHRDRYSALQAVKAAGWDVVMLT
jgi:DNA helicase-2/ATP-dependent DNA helicase PcrA